MIAQNNFCIHFTGNNEHFLRTRNALPFLLVKSGLITLWLSEENTLLPTGTCSHSETAVVKNKYPVGCKKMAVQARSVGLILHSFTFHLTTSSWYNFISHIFFPSLCAASVCACTFAYMKLTFMPDPHPNAQLFFSLEISQPASPPASQTSQQINTTMEYFNLLQITLFSFLRCALILFSAFLRWKQSTTTTARPF